MGLGKATLSFTVLEPGKVPAGRHPRWAALGRSNVGKSSLLNALLHPHEFFRTGKTPGVTRGLIGVQVAMGNSEKSVLELVDLPGFGFAPQDQHERRNWDELAAALRENSRELGLQWIWLVDPIREPGELEEDLMRWLDNEPFALVFTKSDKIKERERKGVEGKWARFARAAVEGPYWVSALKGEGMEALMKSARQFVRAAHEG